mgnify:CR=1 FL=1
MAERRKIKRAETWNELTEENKEVFSNIAHVIRTFDESLQVYAYGSRVDGTWHDDSDYDVVVGGCKSWHKEKLFNMKFDYKVDLKISPSKKINYIKIQ